LQFWDEDIGYGVRGDNVFPEYDKYLMPVGAEVLFSVAPVSATCAQEEKVLRRKKSKRRLRRTSSQESQLQVSGPSPMRFARVAA
jgi:hypothetical protein